MVKESKYFKASFFCTTHHFPLSFVFILLFLIRSASFAQFAFMGSATNNGGGCYVLTSNLNWEQGTAWYNTPINLSQPLTIQYNLNFGTNDGGGADGIAFVMQNQGTGVIGNMGEGIGYQGISPSVAVEFDDWQNGWDPANDHVALTLNGDPHHTSAGNAGCPVVPFTFNIEDGNWHSVQISWDPVTQTLRTYFDCQLWLTYTADLINTVFAGNPVVWWGFTSSTGGANNLQQFCFAPPFSFSTNTTNVPCFGQCNGNASVTNVLGGLAPFTYAWSNGDTTSVDSGLCSGTYTIAVTSFAGCVATDTITIAQPADPLSVVSSFVDVLCSPDSTGSAAVVVTGGALSYSYLWSNGLTDSTISNLQAGIYSVMITDTSGCLDSATFTIAQPLLLSFTASQTNILCFGNSTGIASVMVTGGTLPYTYVWNTFATDTSTITGLPAGIDSVLITDAHGCTHDTSFIISQPVLPLSISSSFVSVSCNPDSTGSATAQVTGGTPIYYYLWSSGQTTASISNLPEGNYSLIVNDTNGCRDSVFIPITQPPLFTASISPDTIICNGPSVTESIIAAGGVPAYNYLWLPGGTTDSTLTISPASTITYTVQVSDANGCSSSPLNTTITVYQKPVANISVSPSTAVFFPQTICYTADSTNANTWLWDFGDNTTDSGYSVCHDFLKGGNYCVTLFVTNNSCSDTSETCVLDMEVVMPNVFSPNDDGLNDTYFAILAGEGITYFKCEIYDRWGLKMAELVRPRQGWEGYTTSGSPASAGTYYYVLSVSWGNELSVHKEGFFSLVR